MKHWHINRIGKPYAHEGRVMIGGHVHGADYTGTWLSKDGAVMKAAQLRREAKAPQTT